MLQALLLSLTAKLAPPGAKGTAIGVYSIVQFFGTFVGAAWAAMSMAVGLQGLVIADVMLLVMWLIVAFGMRRRPR